MNFDDESTDEYKNAMTRRKLLGAAATSTTFLGSGCVGFLENEESTAAPQPEDAENRAETTNHQINDTAPTTEGENAETSPNNENNSEIEQTSSGTDFQVENPNQFGWETEDSLKETTGFCYAEEGEYLGAMDADKIESTLEEKHLSGNDPNNALNDGELIGAVDPLTPVQGTYAIDVDGRHGDQVEFYVQLVGEQDGGVYLNRQGAYEVSELEWAEVFNEC